MSPDVLDDVPPSPPSTPLAAAPVPVAGVVPFSSVDWPGRLAATVFLQGCPWRCPYCHNPDLQAAVGTVGRCAGAGAGSGAGVPELIGGRWREVLDLLDSRRGLLDGVVFTGGEPTMHRGLGEAIEVVRAAGFGVGLHTSDCYPGALEDVLRDHRPNWIGLDVKADPRDAETNAAVAYGGAQFGGAEGGGAQLSAGDKVLRSLRLIVEALGAHQTAGDFPPLSIEVRTTVWPDSPAVTGVPGIADMLAETLGELATGSSPGAALSKRPGAVRPALTWAIQKARPDGVSPDAAAAASFRADRPGWAAEFDALVDDARDRLRGTPVTVIAR
ncbi:radical SAM protein [Corynebacterium xerosis]|uniref:radical SAM protein n=1 Tax=Corynebacterium xerosis TaxID=1725 RepID=UPI0009EC4A1C|nr:radical SAM protein [Corynebacterium xerosis]SQB95946.1 anaerobic ribonucleoside-triphosphate reductase activating protein [Clostridium paraputrificum]